MQKHIKTFHVLSPNNKSNKDRNTLCKGTISEKKNIPKGRFASIDSPYNTETIVYNRNINTFYQYHQKTLCKLIKIQRNDKDKSDNRERNKINFEGPIYTVNRTITRNNKKEGKYKIKGFKKLGLVRLDERKFLPNLYTQTKVNVELNNNNRNHRSILFSPIRNLNVDDEIENVMDKPFMTNLGYKDNNLFKPVKLVLNEIKNRLGNHFECKINNPIEKLRFKLLMNKYM